MEIDQAIFENFVTSGVLDKRHAQSIQEEQKKVMLRREAATGIENGIIIGGYFSHIAKLMIANKQGVSGIDLDAIKSLKNSITPAAKLYNWNILLKEIEVIFSAKLEFVFEILEYFIFDSPQYVKLGYNHYFRKRIFKLTKTPRA